MEVTVSGVPKARRGALRAIIEALHGVYSGDLSVGRTAAVVVEGAVDWAAPKLAAAAEHGIPIVSYEWLLDSQANGFLLHFGPYTLSAQDGRRSSAASSSALQRGGEQSATTRAAAAPAPAWQIVEGAGNPTAHAATPASAERLRAAVHPLPAYLPGMLHGDSSPAKSPAGTSHSDSNLQHQQALVPDFAVLALHEQLPSPVSPTQMHQASTAAACLHDGCSPLLPLLPDVPEAAAGCGQESSKQLPAASHGPLQLDWETAAGGQGLGGPSSQQFPAADQPGKQQPPGAEAPPEAGLGTQSHQAVATTPVSAGTDSDGKVARILSRMTHVTLARGSCLPRWQLPPSPDSCESLQRDRGGSSAGSGSTGSRSSIPLGSLRGRGSAEHPGSNRRGSFHVKEMGGHAERVMDSTGKIAAEQSGPSSVGATGTRCMFQPVEGDEEAQQPDERAQEQQVCEQQGKKEEEQGSLPASTLIRLGFQLPRPPSGSIFEEMAARHGGTSFTAEQRRGVTFHDSATALLPGGKDLLFVAGDATHAARMLYDSVGGTWIHALVLVQAIYRLGDTVWMQHRYLLTADDVQERPEWALALQGHPALEPGEVLLSSGTYHSPMHLIVGQGWLVFTTSSLARLGTGRRHRRVAGQPRALDGEEAGQYTCRRGFDATTCTLVPLRRALEGLTVAV